MNINEVNIDNVLLEVSDSRIKKAEKLKSENDKKRSLCVEYLLNQMVEKHYPSVNVPVELIYDNAGKPHISGDLFYFALSHSGDYVACIISDVPCGVDIERHKDNSYERIARRICTEKELSLVNSCTDFYNIWTLKESVLKATGKGLALDMRTFEFTNKISNIYETTVNGEKYIGKILPSPNGYSLSYIELYS